MIYPTGGLPNPAETTQSIRVRLGGRAMMRQARRTAVGPTHTLDFTPLDEPPADRPAGPLTRPPEGRSYRDQPIPVARAAEPLRRLPVDRRRATRPRRPGPAPRGVPPEPLPRLRDQHLPTRSRGRSLRR